MACVLVADDYASRIATWEEAQLSPLAARSYPADREREEARLRQEDRRRITELEAENERLRRDHTEMTSLRGAAARDEARRRDDGPGPL